MAKKRPKRAERKPRSGGKHTGDENLTTELMVERAIAWRINNIAGTNAELANALAVNIATVNRLTQRESFKSRLRAKHAELLKADHERAKQRIVDLQPMYEAGERKLLASLGAADTASLAKKGAELVIRRRMMQYEFELERLKKGDAGERYVWLDAVPGRKMRAPWEAGVPITPDILTDDRLDGPSPLTDDIVGKRNLTIGFQPHAAQARFIAEWIKWYADRKAGPRHMVLKTGRRYGKTELILACADALCNTKAWWSKKGPPSVLIVCPNNKMARKIYFAHGLVMKRLGARTEITESAMVIRFENGAQITIAGIEAPGSQEGVGHDLIIVDEAGLTEGLKRKFETTLLPMIADRSGRMLIVGTPKGLRRDYAKFIEWGRTNHEGEWALFEAPSIGNPFLPIEAVESARRNLSEAAFRQEFLGEVLSQEGKIFAFDRRRHVFPISNDLAYRREYPLCVSWDFNNNPISIVVGQYQKVYLRGEKYTAGEFRWMFVVLEEFQYDSTFTEQSARLFCKTRWGKEHRGRVELYGDASGNAEDSTSGTTDWALIEKVFHAHFGKFDDGKPRVIRHYEDSNPTLVDSDNAVNSALDPGDGVAIVRINEECKQLIADLEGLVWPEDGSRRRAKARAEAKGLGHACDALRYWIAKKRPIHTTTWSQN